jgi:hypothetical protein
MTTCEYCGEEFTPNPRSRTPQKFCSTRHRVYFHREGGSVAKAGPARASRPSGNSVADAIAALGSIQLPDSKAADAITIDRDSAYPSGWKVTVPPKSAQSADRVRDALNEYADDLQTLARLIGTAAKPRQAKPTRGTSRGR